MLTRREFLLRSAAAGALAILPSTPADPRLRAVAACRLVWHRFSPGQRRQIDAAEQFARGRIDAKQLWDARFPIAGQGLASAAADNAAFPPDQDAKACVAACVEQCRQLARTP